jgi:hypothetical protein
VIEVGLEKAAIDAARYVAESKLGVIRQGERIARLRAMGLPTRDAEDTLDVLQGMVVAAEYFEGLLKGLSRGRQVQDRKPHTELSATR